MPHFTVLQWVVMSMMACFAVVFTWLSRELAKRDVPPAPKRRNVVLIDRSPR